MPRTLDTDGALFEQLRPRLTAISRRIVGSEAEAQDIVQDCYLKWQRADRASLATPVAWLTTVVQRQSIDRLRKRAREEVAALAAGDLVPDTLPAAPEEELLRFDEVGEALGRLLACLSPSERLALVLHEVFECEHADIAAVLGTRAVNTRQHLARARRHLARRLRLQAAPGEVPAEEKLSRELVRRFQVAINGLDVPAMVMLLGAEQPVSVGDVSGAGLQACANDALYGVRLAA